MPTGKRVLKAITIVPKDINEVELPLNDRIEQHLQKNGYKDIEILENVHAIEIHATGKKSTSQFSFKVRFEVIGSGYCCGTYEIGDIEIPNNEIKHLTEDFKKELIAKKLQDVFDKESQKEHEGVRMTYFTVPTTGDIEVDNYKLFIEGALKADFKLAATFINSNSGNILEHYIKYE